MRSGVRNVVIGRKRPSILRAASNLNRGADLANAIGAGKTGWAGVHPHYIASGDLVEFRVLHNFWVFAASGNNAITALGNDGTIEEEWIEFNGVTVRVTYSGASTLAWVDGDFDKASDAIPASAFGVSRGLRNSPVKIKTRGTVSVANGKVPSWNVDHSRYDAGFQAIAFDPAVTTLNSGAALGNWTATGTAPTALARAPTVMLIGRFANGDVRTFGVFGDSIEAGNFDVNYSGYQRPRGVHMRALHGDGTAKLAGITCAINGGKVDPLFAASNRDRVLSLVKYCSVWREEFLLNLFPNAGAANNPAGLASIKTQYSAAWTNIRGAAASDPSALPFRLVRSLGSTRISAASVSGASPDTAAVAVASQATYGPQWDLGGDAQAMNDWFVTQVGVGNGPDKIWDPASLVRASTDPASADYYKFPASFNTDLVHFGYASAQPVADSCRASYLSVG